MGRGMEIYWLGIEISKGKKLIDMHSELQTYLGDLKNKLLSEFPEIDGIILFGSNSRNAANENSDVDIAIISSDPRIEEFMAVYKSPITIDWELIPLEVARQSVDIGDYRYGKVLFEEGIVIYDNREKIEELRQKSRQIESGNEFIELSLYRHKKHARVAEEHMMFLMRSVYQSCLNLSYAILIKKGRQFKSHEIYDRMQEEKETSEYASFLKELKDSMRKRDFGKIQEYWAKFESMKKLAEIFGTYQK